MTAPSIVVISDRLEVQQCFASSLGLCGLAPILASTAEEAVSILSRHRISLLFCSDEMPGDGFEELIRQPWKSSRKVPVAVFSRFDDWQRYLDFLHIGVFDYVLFPLNQGEIERVVRNASRLETPATVHSWASTHARARGRSAAVRPGADPVRVRPVPLLSDVRCKHPTSDCPDC